MSAIDPLGARRNQIPRGIAYMVGSTVMFAGGNAVVKWQLDTYPLGEVAFGRTLFAFLTVAAIVLPRAGWGVLRTRRYREHLQRGLSQFGSMLCWFLAVSVLSLGSATAISFAAPLFTTLLSIVILKEKVGIHRWSALIVGFVGVLIITHPGAGTLTYGALFALGNAVLISTVAIAIRRMSVTESTETLTLYQMSIMTLCTAVPADARVPCPALGRRADGRARRGRQRDRAVLVDALAVAGAALGGGAVQLPVAGLGHDPRFRGLGRRADPGLAGRLGDRRRLGPLHPVARDLAPPAPAGPARTGRAALRLPLSLLEQALGVAPQQLLRALAGDAFPFEDFVDRFGNRHLEMRVVRAEHQAVVAERLGDHLEHRLVLVRSTLQKTRPLVKCSLGSILSLAVRPT